MVCGRALSRLPRAASATTEVIINSIYKIMYVQNRKSGGESETESITLTANTHHKRNKDVCVRGSQRQVQQA